jgi:hypothetical protein
MSASKLPMTIITATIISQAIRGYGSPSESEWMKYRPIPSSAKIVSVMIAPPKSKPRSRATSVVSGISALRKACFMIVRRSVRPLARAVRT